MDDTGIRRIIGPTIALASGKYFDFEDPEGCYLSLRDISTGLSNICRFTGQCRDFYSVAEHSVKCSHLVPPEDAFAALMHDAAEAVLGDVSRPLKSMLPDYKRLESRVEKAIFAQYRLPEVLPESVKVADRRMLAIEQAQCMGNRDAWSGTDLAGFVVKLDYWTPQQARREFEYRFAELVALHSVVFRGGQGE
jgi:5'-deoxynucleotidase YfbR-like HD superfamily hydrolase